MIAEAEQHERHHDVEVSWRGLDALAASSRALADSSTLAECLQAVAEAVRAATGAPVVLARAPGPTGGILVAQAVAAAPAHVAELAGSPLAAAEVGPDEVADLTRLPRAVRRDAERVRAGAVLFLPVRSGSRVLATLELMGPLPLGGTERRLARLAAAEIGLAVRTFGRETGTGAAPKPDALAIAGDALVAGSDENRTADEVARLAAEATGAVCALLWVGERGERPGLLGAYGLPEECAELPAADAAAEAALREHGTVAVGRGPGPAGAAVAATLQLGQPPMGVLQLYFPAGAEPDPDELARLSRFGVRAAHALRAGQRSRGTLVELERTRALLAVVGRASAQLSLSHTLETAVDQVAELLRTGRLAVYLREEDRLAVAESRGLDEPHLAAAERLLELSLGPFRGRGLLVVEDVRADPRLAAVAGDLERAGIEAALAMPLVAHEEVIGLLAVYPARGQAGAAADVELLGALAAQLAVAVQNARLHERAKELGAELEGVLAAERKAARRLRSLYEISRSFAQSLSLGATLEALARTVVGLLAVDAAVIRMPDERREVLVERALHVADVRLADVVRSILGRPQRYDAVQMRELLQSGEPLLLDAARAASVGGPYALLVPFLEKGSTAAVLPIATPAEVLATLTLLSLDPARPITGETLASGLAIATQAALAIDNARLYQQQKLFSDTMQRSLLPRSQPRLEGLELGDVYESSARVEVGGDVYDYLTLEDGRLAVVLGDVTGHGIDAAADMAMAKFVFRSLAREHPEPGEFLAHANEVVVGEIAPGKFITMLYLTVDPVRGELACAGAGHPHPRVVGPDGAVHGLAAGGLALGIEAGQEYEEVRWTLEPGSSVVLYTDGVIEARRDRELYGIDRLDALLAARRDLGPRELAEAVVAECRAFSGGELADDCAVVVLARPR